MWSFMSAQPELGVDPELDRQSTQIADAILRMMRTQGAIRSKMISSEDADAGATFVLLDLVKNGPRRATELAGQMCADPSTVSRQVAALVKAGLIGREA